jgi:tetratricopeptide (TPR) repeat protein
MGEYLQSVGESQGQLEAFFQNGNYYEVLTCSAAKWLLGHDEKGLDFSCSWTENITTGLDNVFSSDVEDSLLRQYLVIGEAALCAFIQSNVTGPRLPFRSEEVIFTHATSQHPEKLRQCRQSLIRSLSVDGEAAYALIPNVELFCLAKSVLTHQKVVGDDETPQGLWARIHVNFAHQRLLSENTDSLQSLIYTDLSRLEKLIFSYTASDSQEGRIKFLLERAAIHTAYGFDVKAREDLGRAAKETGLEFAITGRLGKRTKFQERDISQLVVLAKSGKKGGDAVEPAAGTTAESSTAGSVPQNLDLNDDTLLESISFAQEPPTQSGVSDGESLSESLLSLDPSNQPRLDPLDSIILLSWASSITNTSPQDGLTREETIPYATRVLDDGSSNWQIYTQALLVRSRIEGYRSRTIERSVLQLQALVDQVIAETSGNQFTYQSEANTFLPRPKESESAPVTERLRYIWALSLPTRWDMEAELASRWVSLGGLRTALEIYERLEMWAEAALCWAATDREDKAREVVLVQLFSTPFDETCSEKVPLPPDAPRLFCILGDIDKDPSHYNRAWEISNHRYARAQRSIGRYFVTQKDYPKAAEAYALSLKISRLNHSTWFALGCVFLELSDWKGAIGAFTRTVQLDDTDAEAWSNLAAALLRLPETDPGDTSLSESRLIFDDEEPEPDISLNPASTQQSSQKNKKDALSALNHAARLKPNSAQIWDNILTVSLSIAPPPYSTLLHSLTRVITIRGPGSGESCIDVPILSALITHVIALDDPSLFLSRSLIKLIDNSIVPLITHSADLWRQVARLSLWRGKNSSAMEAYEKAWRARTSLSGWETGTEENWNNVVDATVELVDGYKSLGPKERGEGLGAHELVAKDWKFKARSAVRGIMGKGKGSWEDTEGWERLKGRLDDLKS